MIEVFDSMKEIMNHGYPKKIKGLNISSEYSFMFEESFGERILDLKLREGDVRIVKDGVVVSDTEFLFPKLSGNYCYRLVDKVALLDCARSKYTIIFEEINNHISELNRFLDNLKCFCFSRLWGNLYYTPSFSKGLDRHFDSHDILIVQLYGNKLWDVEGLGQFQLSSGEAVFIPKNTAHSAFTDSTDSLHLSIGINDYSLGDLIKDEIDSLSSKNNLINKPLSRILNDGCLEISIRKLLEEIKVSCAPNRDFSIVSSTNKERKSLYIEHNDFNDRDCLSRNREFYFTVLEESIEGRCGGKVYDFPFELRDFFYWLDENDNFNLEKLSVFFQENDVDHIVNNFINIELLLLKKANK